MCSGAECITVVMPSTTCTQQHQRHPAERPPGIGVARAAAARPGEQPEHQHQRSRRSGGQNCTSPSFSMKLRQSGVDVERAIREELPRHQRPVGIAAARVDPGDQRAEQDLQERQMHHPGGEPCQPRLARRAAPSSARPRVRPISNAYHADQPEDREGQAEMDRQPRSSPRRARSRSGPNETIHQPTAPWTPPRTPIKTSRRVQPTGIRRRREKHANPTAQTSPITRPSCRWPHSHQNSGLNSASVIALF